jgi:hypothetical protein
MYNHFLEFSLEEMEDAYVYFHHIRDYEGCQLVADAYDAHTSLIFN